MSRWLDSNLNRNIAIFIIIKTVEIFTIRIKILKIIVYVDSKVLIILYEKYYIIFMYIFL